jgi:hypothetical protein
MPFVKIRPAGVSLMSTCVLCGSIILRQSPKISPPFSSDI